ncbi:MAG: metal ABC transporter substrate-binding protein [Chloroflexota bacterium]|nr:metal ABC transporter substrate-binding protein [Chloroflexota bacterium]
MNIKTTAPRRLAAHTRTALLLGALLLLLAACGTQQPNAAASAPAPAAYTINVVTTMSILADMVKNVGGKRVTAENIIPVGAVAETYQPTPQNAQVIAAATIVFYNGHGLEGWIDDFLKSAAKPSQPQINLSEDLSALDVGSDDFKQGNPHFWMSAALGAKYVEKIRDGLIQADAAGKDTYTKNAAGYTKQLLELNEALKQQAATIPPEQRKMVTNHDAFPYFAQEYGFTIVGNILGNPESEPSAGELATLVGAIKAQHVKAIFSESQFNPKLANTIADEAGVTIVSNLYTDTLGDTASGVTTYVDMLRYNMQEVVEALK